MKASRFLFAIPAFVIAAATASACSSSSNNGGTGTGDACATLGACCSKLGASNEMICASTASAGNEANCEAQLSQKGVSAVCMSGSSSSNSSQSSSIQTSSSGNNSSNSNHSTTQSSSGGAGSCTNPPSTPPTGWAPPTSLTTPGCTSAETQALAGCDVATTDAGQNACDNTLVAGAPDGSLNACGNCVLSEYAGASPYPTNLGYEVIAIIEPTPGDLMDGFGVNIGQNLGGCIMAASSSAGAQACGKAIMAITACELAVCLPLCAIPNPGNGPLSETAVNAMVNCWSATTAMGGACATYQNAAAAACPAESNDAGTGPFDLCENLINQDDGVDGSAVPTLASQAALLGLMCGGADAGF